MQFIGELTAIGNMVLSGISTVIVKAQGKTLKPSALILIQSIITSISYIILSAITGEFLDMFQINWRALLPLVSAALLGIIFGNLIYFTSLQLIGVSKAYPIAMTYPLLTYLFEIAIFPDVTFNPLKLVGISIVILGIIFISFSKVNNEIKLLPEVLQKDQISDESSLSNSIAKENQSVESVIYIDNNAEKIPFYKKKIVWGIFFAIIASITWAGGTNLIKIGLDFTDVGLIPINAARMTLLVPFAIGIFFGTNRKENKSKFTWKPILLAALAAILSLVIANYLYMIAITEIGASTPAAIAASGPLIATPLSILFLKEKVDWKIILGTIFTIGGIIMIIFLG